MQKILGQERQKLESLKSALEVHLQSTRSLESEFLQLEREIKNGNVSPERMWEFLLKWSIANTQNMRVAKKRNSALRLSIDALLGIVDAIEKINASGFTPSKHSVKRELKPGNPADNPSVVVMVFLVLFGLMAISIWK